MKIIKGIRDFFTEFSEFVKVRHLYKEKNVPVPVEMVDVDEMPSSLDLVTYYHFYVKKKERDFQETWSTERIMTFDEYCHVVMSSLDYGINPWREMISLKTDMFVGYPPDAFINFDGYNELIKGNLYKVPKNNG